jgi:hypothetical protein
MKVKDAPRTSTSIVIRSETYARITQSKNPFLELMRRLFRKEEVALKAMEFLNIIEERQKSKEPLRVDEWEDTLKTLNMGRSSFYSMRNKLLGAGLISIKNGEYRLSGLFSKDLADMAMWWWSAVLKNDPDTLM